MEWKGPDYHPDDSLGKECQSNVGAGFNLMDCWLTNISKFTVLKYHKVFPVTELD